MSGRATPFTAQRAAGARQRRTSEETAAAFLESFQRRGGKCGRDRKSKRLRAIRRLAKPPVPAWQAELVAQRGSMEAPERSAPRPTVTYGTIREALGAALADMLGFQPTEQATNERPSAAKGRP